MMTIPKRNEMRQQAIDALDRMHAEEMASIARGMEATDPTDCCLYHTMIHPRVMGDVVGTIKSYGYDVRKLRKFLGRQNNDGTDQFSWVLEIKW